MKKVIYTCIIGGYDNLNDGQYRTPGYDYVCYTDNPNLKSNFWTIRQIPDEIKNDITLDNTKKNRYVKINPHLFFPDYDFSIYIDGAITIKKDISKFVDDNCLKTIITIPEHPTRKCIYDEAKACIKTKKDTKENIEPQMERYEKEDFPKKYGLTQNNIIFRFHNDPKCIKLMETWWTEVKNGSKRDQLSLFYALWKNKDVKLEYLDSKTCESTFFDWNKTHKKKYSSSQINVPQIRNLIKYRTYYKEEQYKTNHLDRHDSNTIIINTNDEKFPFSKKLNKYWSEYAMLKVIWKMGKQSEYVGIEQYADIIPSTFKTDSNGIYYKRVTKNMSSTVYSQYGRIHISSDMDKVIEILNKKYGLNNKYSNYIKNSHTLYYGSIFVMKWEVFDKMCDFLFGVLDELDKALGLNFDEKKYEQYFLKNPTRKKTSVQGKENYQIRAFGFIAERLVSAFIVTNYSENVPIKQSIHPQSIREEIGEVKQQIKRKPIVLRTNKINIPKKSVIKKTKVFLGTGINW